MALMRMYELMLIVSVLILQIKPLLLVLRDVHIYYLVTMFSIILSLSVSN